MKEWTIKTEKCILLRSNGKCKSTKRWMRNEQQQSCKCSKDRVSSSRQTNESANFCDSVFLYFIILQFLDGVVRKAGHQAIERLHLISLNPTRQH